MRAAKLRQSEVMLIGHLHVDKVTKCKAIGGN